MRSVAMWLLRAVTTTVPVVIAACYGMAYRYTRQGRVVDRATGQGVAGMKVTCAQGGATASTGADGAFTLPDDDRCDSVQVEDADGAANGAYAPGNATLPRGHQETVIPVDPETP